MRNLPVIAIRAAQEIARMRIHIDIDFSNTREIVSFLQEFLERKTIFLQDKQILERALLNSFGKEASEDVERSIREILTETKPLTELISFCVALSDSAGSYGEEIERLRRGGSRYFTGLVA